jgi:hypothetical protein
MHPVTVQVQPLVSADFPGAACALVERWTGAAACLFLQGACGDINPVRNTTGFEDVERYGTALAGETLKVLALLSAAPGEARAKVSVRTAMISLPFRELPDRAEAERDERAAREALEHAASPEQVRTLGLALKRTRDVLGLFDHHRGSLRAEIQAFRIGDLALVGIPGEPFARQGVQIRENSPAPHTWTVGYANDHLGYFPTRAAYAEGGYEVSAGPWTLAGPEAGERLVAAATALLKNSPGRPSSGDSITSPSV